MCDALGIPGPRIPLPRMRNGTEHTSRREQDLPLRPLRTCMDTFQTRFPRQMHLLPELPFRRREDLRPHLHPMQAHLEERHPLPCQMSLLQFNQMERDQLPSPMQTLWPQMVLPERVQRQSEDLSSLQIPEMEGDHTCPHLRLVRETVRRQPFRQRRIMS